MQKKRTECQECGGEQFSCESCLVETCGFCSGHKIKDSAGDLDVIICGGCCGDVCCDVGLAAVLQ